MAAHNAKSDQKKFGRACCYHTCGIFFFLIGILGLAIYVLFTPVYKPVTCDVSGGMLTGVSIPGLGGLEQIPLLGDILKQSNKLGAAVQISITCRNPNPISVTVHDMVGTVFIGTDKTEVGTVEIKSASLPAHGSGVIAADNSVVLDPALATKVLPLMLIGDGVPLQFDIMGRVTVLFLGMGGTPAIRLRCGMMLASAINMLLHPHGPVVGPMSCSESDDIKIPDLYAEDDHTFEKYLALGESIKNAVTVALMLLGFLSGCFFFSVGCRLRGRCRCRKQAQENDAPGPVADQIGKANEECVV
jgi:hypothetical protein